MMSGGMEDTMVHEPPHYTNAEVECIDAIRAALTPEEWRGYLKGSVIKYTWREKLKNGSQDMGKMHWYATWLTGNDPREKQRGKMPKPGDHIPGF